MVVRKRFDTFSKCCFWWLICFAVLGQVTALQAKTIRMDRDLAELAEELGKDRDAMLHSLEAMGPNEFKEQWTAFASKLDEFYDFQKDEIRFKFTGRETGYRKDFALLLFATFRFQGKGAKLSPTPQELVERHTFLQEIILGGSVYPNGSSVPRKMKDIVKADMMMQSALRTQLDGWGEKFREKFEKEFPEAN